MNAKSSPSHPAPDELSPKRSSHVRLLFILIGSIFFAEVVAMSLIYELPPHLDYRIITSIDAGVMTILIFPVLYFLSFRPLILHIEKRQKAEAESREMALFPALNPDGVLQVDATGQIRKVNPAAAQMGFSVGAHLTEVIPDLHELDLRACIATGTTQQVYETQLCERFLLWSIRGAPDLDLAFLYSVDITQRRQAEKAVRQLSRIVEQTEDTVVVTNCDGVIEYVNPAFERLTGYTKEEALGKTPRVLKSDIHDVDFYRNMWNTILAGEVFQSEIANRKKNGELYYEVKTIAPLRDAQGRITHFVATGKDITEHKLDEEKLLKAYDELEMRVQDRTEELRIANSELEDEINVRKRAEAETQRYIEELKNFNNAMVGRELRMIELKKEVNELCERVNQLPRYSLEFDKERR